ncbi:MAG: hypothetical protein SFW36_03595 [Leptolyngbyaceae cyanobacterium bins.59]|nr:hypothetical protein [Leptolyngbyaceae cyanobacterium bins.59]
MSIPSERSSIFRFPGQQTLLIDLPEAGIAFTARLIIHIPDGRSGVFRFPSQRINVYSLHIFCPDGSTSLALVQKMFRSPSHHHDPQN